MKIEITNDGEAFRCFLQGWPESAAEQTAWQDVIGRTVQYAFESRSATTITVSPTASSIGHELPCPQIVHNDFLVNVLTDCSAEILADIARSEDFRRGLLWPCGERNLDAARVLAIAAEIDLLAERPRSSTEVLLVLDDGYSIHWLRPGRDPGPLIARLSVA